MHPALFHSSSPSQGHKTFDGHLRTYMLLDTYIGKYVSPIPHKGGGDFVGV